MKSVAHEHDVAAATLCGEGRGSRNHALFPRAENGAGPIERMLDRPGMKLGSARRQRRRGSSGSVTSERPS
jgi:hypothetical protein